MARPSAKKQSTILVPVPKLHAVSLPPDVKSKDKRLSSSSPSAQVPSYNETINLSPEEKIDDVKRFSRQTGLPILAPTIVLSSEFLPIYDHDKRTKQGDAVLLKEHANVLNAKVSITLLNQSESVKQAININKAELRDYVQLEDKFLLELIKKKNDIHLSMNISAYILSTFNTPGSLYAILLNSGYSSSNIINFSETKLWQQALIELKKDLTSYSSGLTSENFTRKYDIAKDKDPYTLSDIDEQQNGIKRIGLNYFYKKLPLEKDLFVNSRIEINLTLLMGYINEQYIDIHSHPGAPGIILPKLNIPEVRRISILANCLFKETIYSSFLTNQIYSDVLSSKYNFEVSRKNGNHKVWDHLIGRFTSSVLDAVKRPIGDSNSLFSFSQESVLPEDNAVSDDSYFNVLTLEDNNIENSDITPGSFYYVDSSLMLDGSDFDLSRIERLITKTRSAHETTKTILNFMGYEVIRPAGGIEKFAKRRNDVNFADFVKSLLIVESLYKKYISIEKISVPFKGSINVTNAAFDYNAMSEDNKYNSIDIRFAALICKTASSPITLYKPVSQKLKSLLFMWLMSYVTFGNDSDASSVIGIPRTERQLATDTESGSSHTDFINTIENNIIELLTAHSPSKLDKNIVSQALGRTFPLKAGHLDIDSNSKNYTGIDRPGARHDVGIISGFTEGLNISEANYSSEEINILGLARSAYTALNNQYRSAIHEFKLDASSGLWRTIIEALRKVYKNTSVFFDDDKKASGDSDVIDDQSVNYFTAYSGFSRVAYMHSYFDLILKIISLQTPEDLLGTYSTSYEYVKNYKFASSTTTTSNTFIDVTGIGTKQIDINDFFLDLSITNELGFIVSDCNPDTIKDYFSITSILNNQNKKQLTITNKLEELDRILKSEEFLCNEEVNIFRRFLSDLNKSANSFKDFMSKNFDQHRNRIKSLYALDKDLAEEEKNSIINQSFTEEQIKLTRYISSEFLDKISLNSDAESKLRSIPAFTTFPEKYSDFLPMSELDLISCSIFSPYFKNSEFLPNKGHNKKIISVGIPPGLNRKIRSLSSISSDSLQSLIRIKVFKIDRLLPSVIFLPKSYVFDMNRFPTRVIGNWDFDNFTNNEFNLLKIPNKLMLSSGEISVYRDFNDSFPSSVYGSALSTEEKLEIYANHSISFLSEEYLKWFTGCKFDETRYIAYSKLISTRNEGTEDQFAKTLALISQQASSDRSRSQFQFFDAVSGQNFQIPVKNPSSSNTTSMTQMQPKTTKTFIIPMDETIKAYFGNETFLSDTLILKKRILYPKKFDRVFSIIIDPDNFYIDASMTTSAVLISLKSLGAITGGDVPSSPFLMPKPYKSREAHLGDVSLIEYFVTVEPFTVHSAAQ